MNDEDFMKELQELTKNMSKEFSTNEKSTQSVKDTPTPTFNNNTFNQFNNFDMNLEGSEGDYFKEIQKLLSGAGNMNFDIDDSDPGVKDMMKLLSKIFSYIYFNI